MNKQRMYKMSIIILIMAGFIIGYFIGKLTMKEPQVKEKNAYDLLQEGYDRLNK